MAVVEEFLLKQLQSAINKKKPDTILSRMFETAKECETIMKDLIEPKMEPPINPIIKENLYYLNNVMTEWHALLDKHLLRTPEAMLSAEKLQEKLSQIKKNLEVVPRKKMEESVKDAPKPDSEIYRWSHRSVDLEKVHGIKDIAMIIERLVENESFKAIGIVGMPGVGKTTLCQKVFGSQQVKSRFCPRIWVCLSKQPNVGDYRQELVKRVLMGLGFGRNKVDQVGEGEGGLSLLLLALRLQLKRQRYLIVLDDVWSVNDDFNGFCSSLTEDDDKEKDRLHNGLPKMGGGAVIVTGRSPIMLKNMVGEKNVHSLPLADEESCWKIFKDAVEKGGTVKVDEVFKDAQKEEDQRRLKDEIVDEIVKKFAGLPLTAKMLAQIEHEKAIGNRPDRKS